LNALDGFSQCSIFGQKLIIDTKSTDNVISFKTKYDFANGEFNDFNVDLALDCYFGTVSSLTKLHINLQYQTTGTYVLEGAFDTDNWSTLPSPSKGKYWVNGNY
jgi:hypothetical protein